VSCTGLVSTSGIAAQIEAQEAAALATEKARKKTSVIAGVVVTLVILLLLGGIGVFLFMRRRRMKEITPRQFESGSGSGDAEAFQETSTHILSINAFIAPSSPTHPRSPRSPGPSVTSNTLSRTSVTTPGPASRRFINSPPESNHSVSSTGTGLSVRNPNLDRPSFSSFPTASVRRSAKEIEAGMSTSHSIDSEYYDSTSTDVSSSTIERSRSAVATAGPSGAARPVPARSASMGDSGAPGEEIIFQHQDAGIVRELPPPYIDRGREP